MDARRVKDGDVMKYKSGFLGSKWKIYHVVLFSDSKLCWYDQKGDRKPKGSILLKDVVPYICVGLMTDRMPVKRPSVPDGYSVHHLVGIGMDPRADTVHWFLFSSDTDIEQWFAEITKTLPTPTPQQQPVPPPHPGTVDPNSGYVPPAKYPDAPPPVQPTYPPPPVQPVGGGGTYPHSSPPPPPYYNQGRASGGYGGGGYGSGGGHAGGPTTVIIDRGGSGYGGGSGLGAGLGGAALGFGSGMLLGSLMSYGMGSMWGGHSMLLPSYGGGLGMGGGYSSYSDNDTNITNNYYNYPDPNTSNSATGANETQPIVEEPAEDQADTAGGDYDDYGDTEFSYSDY
ncbi:PH domain protein [Dictyocaulus viviparus]|uniref:PH domain protein n=1 Tax=Dictyocaulus viviparus TaxID=29172 RepID=A0A0D8Y4M7_DICVI|nr:PH domain protein [Dictyocaulus viviparus]